MTEQSCTSPAVHKRPSNSDDDEFDETSGRLPAKHGRLDLADENSVMLLQAVMGGSTSHQDKAEDERENMSDTSEDESEDEEPMAAAVAAISEEKAEDDPGDILSDDSSSGIFYDVPDTYPDQPCRLLQLPSELLDNVVDLLDPPGLLALAQTCRRLHSHASSDLVWQRHVQANVPSINVRRPYPCVNFRDLFLGLDPYWFLPRYKIWFCDDLFVGKVLLARYDPRRGCIEAYRLVAEHENPSIEQWEMDGDVTIHSFTPTVQLHLDQPVLQIDVFPKELSNKDRAAMTPRRSSFSAEIPMHISASAHHGIFSNLLLVKAAQDIPPKLSWPPPSIPSTEHVSIAQEESYLQTNKPRNRFEVSEKAFKIRRWARGGGTFFAHVRSTLGARIDGDLHTYSTLDPYLYTPTVEKPYRGIWVGDYAGHGCEFLLIHQPDTPQHDDQHSSHVVDYEQQRPDESFDEFQERRKIEKKIYNGRLEAIKLTGDPNVPRGEYTFIVDDLGPNGFVRISEEQNFKGARIVRSRGHIATRGFINDKYIESQLIMISPNRLAQYWVGFGHISFYERVNIDDFLTI